MALKQLKVCPPYNTYPHTFTHLKFNVRTVKCSHLKMADLHHGAKKLHLALAAYRQKGLNSTSSFSQTEGMYQKRFRLFGLMRWRSSSCRPQRGGSRVSSQGLETGSGVLVTHKFFKPKMKLCLHRKLRLQIPSHAH